MGLLDSQEYQQLQGLYGAGQTQTDIQQSPLIAELKKMQDQARAKASNTANTAMYGAGFGRSTFAPQVATQAGTQAAMPFNQQIAQTGQNIEQNNAQKLMQMLGISTQYRGQDIQQNQFAEQMAWNKLLQQKAEEEAKRKRESSFMNNLIYGGLTALLMTNPVTAPLAAGTASQVKAGG